MRPCRQKRPAIITSDKPPPARTVVALVVILAVGCSGICLSMINRCPMSRQTPRTRQHLRRDADGHAIEGLPG